MTITALQTDIIWNSPQENRNTAERLIRGKAGSDVYVLPEMFPTGFAIAPEGIAETEGGESLAWMQKMATETNAAIAGSIAIKTMQGDYRNRLYFVKPDGEYAFYDKRHLFTYADEHLRYTAGTAPVTVNWRRVNFMLQVCYDLRFPCFSRNKFVASSDIGLQSSPTPQPYYDCCIYVASWPESRRAVWDVLLRARAIENQCYVVGVNRIGDDPSCHYNGGTTIIDPYGKVTATAPDSQQHTITAPLDLDRLRRFREKFPLLRDAD